MENYVVKTAGTTAEWYRLHAGNYRVAYEKGEYELTILVIRAGRGGRQP